MAIGAIAFSVVALGARAELDSGSSTASPDAAGRYEHNAVTAAVLAGGALSTAAIGVYLLIGGADRSTGPRARAALGPMVGPFRF
jgi:hypothetical protein